MKNKIFNFLFLGVCLVFISGCSNDNFFDIQSAMSPPALTQGQEEIKNAVKEHFGIDFIWKYPLIDDKYSPVTKLNMTNTGEIWQLAFCQISDENHKIHMLFLRQNKDKWEIFEDIIHTVLDIEKVYIQDIDKDGINEIIIFGKNFEDSYSSIYAYKYKDDHISEITVPARFFQEVNEKTGKLNMGG